MNTQLNKPTFDPTRRTKLPISSAQKFISSQSPGILLYRARRVLGVPRKILAAEMGIPNSLLRKYETKRLRIPSSVLLKIFMFGLDFWTDGISWQTTSKDDVAVKAEQSEQEEISEAEDKAE